MDRERWSRVEALYHSALERPRKDRAAFLTEACADPELRREVEALLAQPGDGILDHPVAQAVAGGRLGPYEIRRAIGAGGMGQVFKARDSRLGRSVAIKICSAEFASRFAREAKAISALNHPNICTLYDVGPNYLVMELVEGPTLAERIKRGPVPQEEALAIAKQIAEAVEAAHERGIVHRDLKPGNIKLRPDGTVKVLDFGLAKVTESSDAGPLPEDSPTLTLEAATREGTILGTAAYMSPEQALGKAADKRADIWSFGAVLYEMLSGRRAFGGESASDILATVLKLEPDWSALPGKTPTPIRGLIRRCLTKDRRQRLQAIGDARIVVEECISGAQPEIAEPAPSRRTIMLWAIAAGVLAIVAIAAIAVAWRATRPVNRPLVRLNVDLGPDVTLPNLAVNAHNVILSPDGTRLVYVSGNPPRLYTRRLDQSKATELPGTDDAGRPFFSPDGQWVGFSKRLSTKLSKISVEGGAVVPLADVGGRMVGGSWGADGNIIVGGLARGLLEVPASGGAPTTVLETAPGEYNYIFPQILPGGKAVLFDNRRPDPSNNDSTEVFSFASRRRKTVVRGGANPYYLPSGHLIYTSKGTLFAIAFDLNRLETRGTAVPILDDVAYYPSTDGVDLDFAQNGALIYCHGPGMPRTVRWLVAMGEKEPLLEPGDYSQVRVSPDGKRLAVRSLAGDVWVYELERDAMTRLTSGGGYSGLVWSPDGRYVILGSRSKGIYWTRADGAGQPQPLTQSNNSQTPWSFTPDGKWLAYHESAGTGGRTQIWMLPLEAQDGQLKAGKPEQFPTSHLEDFNPVFSPDGHWIAYASYASGKYEFYVRAFPPPASGQPGQWQISNGGVDRHTRSVWSRNSRDLIYQSGDQLMAVSYSVHGDSFVAEKPRVWIDKLGGSDWDLAPDDKRVAVVTPVAAPEAPKQEHEVTILFNFFDELRRRIP